MALTLLLVDTANFWYHQNDKVYVEWEGYRTYTELSYADAVIKIALVLYLYARRYSRRRLEGLHIVIPCDEVSERHAETLREDLQRRLEDLLRGVQDLVSNMLETFPYSEIALDIFGKALLKVQFTRTGEAPNELVEFRQMCKIYIIKVEESKCEGIRGRERDVYIYVVLPLVYMLARRFRKIYLAFVTLDKEAKSVFFTTTLDTWLRIVPGLYVNARENIEDILIEKVPVSITRAQTSKANSH